MARAGEVRAYFRKVGSWFTEGYNAVGILFAAAGWFPPVGAAAAQSLPDVVVMLNSSGFCGAVQWWTRDDD